MVRRGLVGIVVARLAVNGGIRVVYPFLSVIADGLGVSLVFVALLVASRSVAGLVGPVVARGVQPHRVRALMLSSQLMVITGCLLIIASAASPAFLRLALVSAGFIATGLARPLFDLPMQTWVSAHVPRGNRGRALGVTELGWALSLAATVPLAGVLIERFGWRSPFLLVAGMAVGGITAILLTLLRNPTVVPVHTTATWPVHHATHARTRRIPTGVAACIGVGLAVAAGELLFVVYGDWLTQDLGLTSAQIGVWTLVIVAAELTGEGAVVAMSDRVGLCRMLFGALLVSAATYAAFGAVDGRLGLAVVAVGAIFVAFEITIGALTAFTTTIVDGTDSRARLLGTFMAAIACGNATGAVLAPLAFAHGGIALSGLISACMAVGAAAVLRLGSRPLA